MYTTTGVPGSSRNLGRQWKSVSLRTNEEFVLLCNDVSEATRLHYQGHRDVDGVLDYWSPLRLRKMFRFCLWERLHSQVLDLDQEMKQLERHALFSEVLAGIVLTLEMKIFPYLRQYLLYYTGKSHGFWGSDLITRSLVLRQKKFIQRLVEALHDCLPSGSLESAHKVVVSALALLSFVYQYLIGCVDKGGSKTYSAGSFLFRLIFVAIVLFLGSYVWIKFRQASYSASRRKRKVADESYVPGRVYRRAAKDSAATDARDKYEPRFTPLREILESGTSRRFNFLSLGSYNTRHEAEIVLRIAAFLYGEVEGRPVQFEDGVCLPFPSVTDQEKCPPSGEEKRVWVTHKTKEVYAQLLRKKTLRSPDVETGSRHGHDGEASRSDASPSAPDAPSTAMELLCFTPAHGGNGVVDPPVTSDCHGVGQVPLHDRAVFSASFLDWDFDQGLREWEDSDFPAMDNLDMAEGDDFEKDRVRGCEFTSVPPQSRAVDIPTSAIVANQPRPGVGDGGLHHRHDGEARCSAPSPSAPGARSTAVEWAYLASPRGGNGSVEQPTTREFHGLGQEPPIAPETSSPVFTLSELDQICGSCAQGKENDFLAKDDLFKVVGDYSKPDRVFGFKSASEPPQLRALDILTSANLATEITSQQLASLPEQVQLQQQVANQEQRPRPEEFGEMNVGLQQELLLEREEISVLREKLRKSDEEKSEAELKLRTSEVKNKELRSMVCQLRLMLLQFAKLIPASDEDGSPVVVHDKVSFFV